MGLLIFTICVTLILVAIIITGIRTGDTEWFGIAFLFGVLITVCWGLCVFTSDDKTITIVNEHAPIEIRTPPTKIMVFSGDLETTYTEIKYSKLTPTNFLVVQTYNVFGKKTGKEIRADIDLK